MGIFSGHRDTDDEDDQPPPLDDAADFPLTERQRVIRNAAWAKRQMMPTYNAIFGQDGSLGAESRRQKYLPVRRSR